LHSLFKSLASFVLRQPRLAALVRQQRQVRWVSLCFHRFAGPANAASGHDLDAIDDSLRWLRRCGFVFADLESTVRGALNGRFPDRPTVVVTIDDGFADLVPALPVFGRHGCPVSVFLATDFLDRRAPLWWDQLQLLLARAPGQAMLHDVAGISWSARWESDRERVRQGEVLIEMVKRRPEPTRFAVMEALASLTGAPPFASETAGYAPLRWDDVRALEREGVRFGPHTHTHPILSALDHTQAKYEIDTSWARVREELRQPLSIFAYPDGTPWSFTQRDCELVRAAGLEAAVTMDGRWALPAAPPVDPFRFGRIGFQAQLADLQASVLRLASPGYGASEARP
jgi:peptidoglycan/xylan/chitin deacetylase (PgdA/CDA1 family)